MTNPTLRCHSQRFGEDGGIDAQAVQGTLGRPDMLPLEVLVREAVQNSWDARSDTSRGGAISIDIRHRRLKQAQLEYLRTSVLTAAPSSSGINEKLSKALSAGCEVIEFADYGTFGLGGPTRADLASELPGQRKNFVDFILKIGRSKDKAVGGGTYGYGKASFYLASAISTVIVDSLCRDAHGDLERRFIVCSLGQEFTQDGHEHTGRHWWCAQDASSSKVQPLTGADADAAASSLGLPARNGNTGLGTTVAVIQPNLDEFLGTDSRPADFIAEAVIWNFWPKLVPTHRHPKSTIAFSVYEGDEKVPLGNPLGSHPTRFFAEAKIALDSEHDAQDSAGLRVRLIQHGVGKKTLGKLALRVAPMPSAPPLDLAAFEDPQIPRTYGQRVTRSRMRHVALLRNEELVVTYEQGPEPTKPELGIAGVFRCADDDPEVERAFALSEPPTHDKWSPDFVKSNLDDQAQGKQWTSWVNVTLQRIKSECSDIAGIGQISIGDTSKRGGPLGELAHTLASALAFSLEGPGTSKEPPGRGAGKDEPAGGKKKSGNQPKQGKSRKPTVTGHGSRLIRLPDGSRGIGADFTVANWTEGSSLNISLSVIVDRETQQSERESPAGTDGEISAVWKGPSGQTETGATISPAESADGDWTVELPLSGEFRASISVDSVSP